VAAGIKAGFLQIVEKLAAHHRHPRPPQVQSFRPAGRENSLKRPQITPGQREVKALRVKGGYTGFKHRMADSGNQLGQ
jgi:hypothetical protein